MDSAMFTALELAVSHASELHILHVLESSYSGKYRHFVKHYKTGEEIVAYDAYERAVRRDMEEALADFVPPLERYTIEVTQGIPWEQILKRARKEQVNLIVLGAHTKRADQEGFARITNTMGSTIEEVIMRERCPVMIINEPARREQLRFERILVPVDFSESCTYALRFAVDLGKNTGGRLHVFHASADLDPNEKKGAPYVAIQAKLKNFTAPIPVPASSEYIVQGGSPPYLEILKYAAEQGVDLIVMGSHTKKNEKKPYIGSAVVQVSCRSLRPVVVVNASKALSASKKPPMVTQDRRHTHTMQQPGHTL
jgi:nucleotide-binding universal stress UspA family protein